jgi:hypothetical protein
MMRRMRHHGVLRRGLVLRQGLRRRARMSVPVRRRIAQLRVRPPRGTRPFVRGAIRLKARRRPPRWRCSARHGVPDLMQPSGAIDAHPIPYSAASLLTGDCVSAGPLTRFRDDGYPRPFPHRGWVGASRSMRNLYGRRPRLSVCPFLIVTIQKDRWHDPATPGPAFGHATRSYCNL